MPVPAPALVRIRRQLTAGLSSAVLLELALNMLPFWPNGLLPQDVTTYLLAVALSSVSSKINGGHLAGAKI